jgi:hypothetical protein
MARPEDIHDPTIRHFVERARAAIRAGDATEAVRRCARGYLALLDARPELMDETVEAGDGLRAPRVMGWPALGANLSLDSVLVRRPRIEVARARFALSEAMTYYEYLLEAAVAAGV